MHFSLSSTAEQRSLVWWPRWSRELPSLKASSDAWFVRKFERDCFSIVIVLISSVIEPSPQLTLSRMRERFPLKSSPAPWFARKRERDFDFFDYEVVIVTVLYNREKTRHGYRAQYTSALRSRWWRWPQFDSRSTLHCGPTLPLSEPFRGFYGLSASAVAACGSRFRMCWHFWMRTNFLHPRNWLRLDAEQPRWVLTWYFLFVSCCSRICCEVGASRHMRLVYSHGVSIELSLS